MNANLEAALARCTIDDGRAVTAAPFSAVVEGRPVHIATDGKMLLIVDDPAGDANAAGWEQAMAVISRNNAPPTHQASRADLIEWAGQDYRTPCPECEQGLIDAKKCKRCGGKGVVECSMDCEHECPNCKGEGWSGTACAACNASGFLQNETVSISIPALSINLDAHLIGGLFDLLPGERIGIVDGPAGAVFHGPGWRLIVASLTRKDAPIRELETMDYAIELPEAECVK